MLKRFIIRGGDAYIKSTIFQALITGQNFRPGLIIKPYTFPIMNIVCIDE